MDSLFSIRPNLRPLWFRLLVSWPAQHAVASTFMAFHWAIATAFGLEPVGLFVVGKVGEVEKVARVLPSAQSTGQRSERPLRIAQITDPHLGPFIV